MKYVHPKEQRGCACDWTFYGFARQFDGHVRQHLPWYAMITMAVAHIAKHYIPQKGRIYDIGASTGNIGRALAPVIAARRAELVAVEQAPDMVLAYNAPGRVVQANALTYPFKDFDVATLFLTLMFLPVAQRIDFIETLRSKLNPGGAIIIVDKHVPPAGYPATISARLTSLFKLEAGATPGEIAEKDLCLTGVQRPIKLSEIEPCTELFRFGDFGGWVIEG